MKSKKQTDEIGSIAPADDAAAVKACSEAIEEVLKEHGCRLAAEAVSVDRTAGGLLMVGANVRIVKGE